MTLITNILSQYRSSRPADRTSVERRNATNRRTGPTGGLENPAWVHPRISVGDEAPSELLVTHVNQTRELFVRYFFYIFSNYVI